MESTSQVQMTTIKRTTPNRSLNALAITIEAFRLFDCIDDFNFRLMLINRLEFRWNRIFYSTLMSSIPWRCHCGIPSWIGVVIRPFISMHDGQQVSFLINDISPSMTNWFSASLHWMSRSRYSYFDIFLLDFMPLFRPSIGLRRLHRIHNQPHSKINSELNHYLLSKPPRWINFR